MTNSTDSALEPLESSVDPGSAATEPGQDEVSDLRIDTLRSEAAEAGDFDVVALCDRALEGDGLARAKCAAAVRAIAAELDGEPA